MPKKNQPEHRDDIHSVLRQSGILSPSLDRFEEASSRMWELEWKLMRRAADEPICKHGSRNPSGD
jgi:hypothetical protein